MVDGEGQQEERLTQQEMTMNNNIMNKQDIIGNIMRALTASDGHTWQRSYCGKYAIFNHGRSSYYDDLKFFLRLWKEEVAYWTTTEGAARAQERKDIAAGLAFEVTVGGDTFTVYR
jgi:hypothetical protein